MATASIWTYFQSENTGLHWRPGRYINQPQLQNYHWSNFGCNQYEEELFRQHQFLEPDSSFSVLNSFFIFLFLCESIGGIRNARQNAIRRSWWYHFLFSTTQMNPLSVLADGQADGPVRQARIIHTIFACTHRLLK